jgi:hypothetical protein
MAVAAGLMVAAAYSITISSFILPLLHCEVDQLFQLEQVQHDVMRWLLCCWHQCCWQGRPSENGSDRDSDKHLVWPSAAAAVAKLLLVHMLVGWLHHEQCQAWLVPLEYLDTQCKCATCRPQPHLQPAVPVHGSADMSSVMPVLSPCWPCWATS